MKHTLKNMLWEPTVYKHIWSMLCPRQHTVPMGWLLKGLKFRLKIIKNQSFNMDKGIVASAPL